MRGIALADESPICHSRVFCTRWNGLTMASGQQDALDDAEYSGSLISLLQESLAFVKRNTRKAWFKEADRRVEQPDYPERPVMEGIVNALIHRNYLEVGSEIHIDIYDDRLEIYSPGGMCDGINVQDRDIMLVPSRRRNPIIADVFQRLNYMERRGSGFKKIIGDYKTQYNYHDEFSPIFKSQYDSFILILKNLNYSVEAIHDARLSWAEGAHDTAYDGAYDTAHEAVQDKLENIVRFCSVPRTKDEIMKHMGLSSKRQFSERYMKPLLESGRLLMTLPDKPRSKNQKYVAAK